MGIGEATASVGGKDCCKGRADIYDRSLITDMIRKVLVANRGEIAVPDHPGVSGDGN